MIKVARVEYFKRVVEQMPQKKACFYSLSFLPLRREIFSVEIVRSQIKFCSDTFLWAKRQILVFYAVAPFRCEIVAPRARC